MERMYDKDKLQKNFLEINLQLQDNKHKHIMEEIEACKKAKITIFHRGSD